MMKVMVHDLSPFLFRFDGDFGLRWYGLSYVAGFFLSYLIIYWLVRRQYAGFRPAMVFDFVTACAIGTLLGGRLGYCLFFSPDLFLKFRMTFPFWGVFAMNEGGMSSAGGVIGVVIASVWFARRYGLNKLYLFDLAGVSAPLGIFLGRIANFMNAELIGLPCETPAAHCVKFPTEIYSWAQGPTERLSALADAVMTLPGWGRDQWLRLVAESPREPASQRRVEEVLVSLVEQIQRGNGETREALAPLLVPRHPSQLYAALLEGLLLFIVLWIFWRKPRKAGTVGAFFLAAYGGFRMFVEPFRGSEAGAQLWGWGMTHWLNFCGLLLGLILFVFWNRSGSVVIPGWVQAQSIRISRRL